MKTMVTMEKILLTSEKVVYKYFPEGGKEFGKVSYNRKNGEGSIDSMVPGFSDSYACHALSRIRDYEKQGKYLDKDLVAWY